MSITLLSSLTEVGRDKVPSWREGRVGGAVRSLSLTLVAAARGSGSRCDLPPPQSVFFPLVFEDQTVVLERKTGVTATPTVG